MQYGAKSCPQRAAFLSGICYVYVMYATKPFDHGTLKGGNK